MLKTQMIWIMLEKKDYDMIFRSFDTEISCVFFMTFCFVVLFNVIFKVKILENGCSSHTFLKYDNIWHHMISYFKNVCELQPFSRILTLKNACIWYDVCVWYDVCHVYDLIAAADAAAETCETNGKPKLFQEFWLWKWR